MNFSAAIKLKGAMWNTSPSLYEVETKPSSNLTEMYYNKKSRTFFRSGNVVQRAMYGKKKENVPLG